MISSSLTDLVVANAMSSVQNPKRKWRVLDEYPWRKLGQSIAEASVGMSSVNDGQVRDETNNLDALRIQMVSFEQQHIQSQAGDIDFVIQFQIKICTLLCWYMGYYSTTSTERFKRADFIVDSAIIELSLIDRKGGVSYPCPTTWRVRGTLELQRMLDGMLSIKNKT